MSLAQDGGARPRIRVRHGLLRTGRWSLRYDTRALLVCGALTLLTAGTVVLAAGTGLTATAVAAAGPIPFVAMAAPQPARRVTRAAGPNVLPAGWTGALPVTAADLVTQRLTGPALLPVGVLTGVAGGACLARLLRGERRGARL